MQYAQIRHLDNIKGFAFGVSETEYVATEVMQVAQPLAELTYSNMKVIVDQQEYLFQNLWDKATPADQKIKEIEEGIEPPRTEVIHSLEQSMPRIISFWNRAKTTMNVDADNSWPILAIQEPRFRDIITDAYARNIRIRVITDITKDNIEHCKQLTQYCELYHSERTKSNLAVSDTEYVSWSNVADMQNLSFVISNEREIVEQHTYLFESLLSKAIPAQLKIREIEEGIEPENTEFFYGAEATTSAILEWMSRLGKMDAVVDPTAPSVAMGLEPLRNAYISAKKRGVKIRWVTEITKDNARYCKEAMKLEIEIRHLDGIKGNFAVSENVYIAAATLEEAKPVPIWMRSTVKMFREQQQYVFDTLWNKAIPAEHRINEIEENIPAERTEVVSDPLTIEPLYKNIINSAKQEIMLILPTTVDTFANEKRIAIIDSLKESAKRNVKIRILVHSKREDDTAQEQDINNLKPVGILVNQLSIRPVQKSARA